MAKGDYMTKAKRSQLVVHGGNKRNEIQRDMDMWWIVGEVAKGRTYHDIAMELNSKHSEYHLSDEQVRLDVNRCMVEWKRQNMENIDATIARELARIEKIEAIVMENFEKSKVLRAVDYASLMKRGMSIEEIDEMFASRVPGDPRYLDTLLRVQMQKLKLLGIDKGNDVPQTTIVSYNFGGMSDDALAEIADRLQDQKAKDILKTGMIDEQ